MKVFLPLLICSTLTLSSVKGRSFLITKTLPTLREEEIKELESYSRKVEPKESTYKNNGSNYLHLRYPNPDPGIYNLRVNVSLMNSLVPNPLSPYSLYDSFIYVQGDEHWEIIFVIEEREMNIYKCEYTDLYDPILHLRRLEYSCKIEILFIRDRGTPASGDAEEYIICREYAEMSIVYNGENNHQITMTGISQRKNICPPGVCTIDTAIETEVNLCLDKHCTEFQDFFTLTYGDNFFLLIQIVDIRLREQFNLELLNIQYKFANMAVDINITQAVTTSSSGYLIIQCHALKTGHFIIEILTKLTTSHNLRDLSSAPISFKALKSMTQFTVCDWGDDNQCYTENPVYKDKDTTSSMNLNHKLLLYLVFAIIVILILIIVCLSWVIHYGTKISKKKEHQQSLTNAKITQGITESNEDLPSPSI